jgi:hypothetical protein
MPDQGTVVVIPKSGSQALTLAIDKPKLSRRKARRPGKQLTSTIENTFKKSMQKTLAATTTPAWSLERRWIRAEDGIARVQFDYFSEKGI